ncbi:ABC transporter permease [Streptomyces sp. NPDC021100]|uniref:ABC transporter permease n=1 Tax=Streptomyces sp. NPDC021100 TaxID=3365114 RepID=UPI0037B5DA17
MTATLPPASSPAPAASTAPEAGRGRFRPRGFVWLVLRQHRATLVVLTLLLVAELVQLALLGYLLRKDADIRALADLCAGGDRECAERWSPAADFRAGYGDALHFNGLLVQYVPLLAGLFTAGPMVARELESGTWRLAWTQSLPPARWLAAKLAVPTVLVLVGVSLMSALYTWCWTAVPTELLPGQRWYDSFGMLGPMPVADALCGVAFGALAALATRRTVPAMVLTLVGYGTVRSALGYLRPHLWPRTRTVSLRMPGYPNDGTWVIGRGMLTRSGEHISDDACGVGVSPERCLTTHNADRWYLDHHPPGDHWPLAWLEAGILAALAALAAWAALRWVRHIVP